MNTDASTGGSESALARRYRKLMRWYPPNWRQDNEDAMLGILLEVAEHEHRDAPTSAERVSLLREGLTQWIVAPPKRSWLQVVVLALGALFSIFYAVVIIWAPATRYPGSVGPFANPTIFTCLLIVLAFGFALVGRDRIANLLAVGAACAQIVFGILAATHPAFGPGPWEGPSPITVVLFVALALLGGVPLARVWMVVVGGMVFAAAAATCLVVEFVEAELGYFSVVSTVMTICIAADLCVAAAITAQRLWRPRVRQ